MSFNSDTKSWKCAFSCLKSWKDRTNRTANALLVDDKFCAAQQSGDQQPVVQRRSWELCVGCVGEYGQAIPRSNLALQEEENVRRLRLKFAFDVI